MNEVPFLGEIGYVPAPKSISFGNVFLIVVFLFAIGGLIYHFFKLEKPAEGERLSAAKAPVFLK